MDIQVSGDPGSAHVPSDRFIQRHIIMITIEIDQEVNTHEDMIDVLEEITRLMKQGMTSGYEPAWSLHGEEEVEDKDKEDAETDR